MIEVIGDLSPDNPHIWSRVHGGGGCSATMSARDYKFPIVVAKRWRKKSRLSER